MAKTFFEIPKFTRNKLANFTLQSGFFPFDTAYGKIWPFYFSGPGNPALVVVVVSLRCLLVNPFLLFLNLKVPKDRNLLKMFIRYAALVKTSDIVKTFGEVW